MRAGALAPYEDALSGQHDLDLIAVDGTVVPLEIRRYLDEADAADRTVLAGCIGPVLDVGCGPGRIVHALSCLGIPALGIDIADVAVQLTTKRGVPALSRDVFARIPGEGRWPTVLVLDGNIGIGGDVTSLLLRLASLLAASGNLIVETSTDVSGVDEVLRVRFLQGVTAIGPEFKWAVVAADALEVRAGLAGLRLSAQWSTGGREFLRFERMTDVA